MPKADQIVFFVITELEAPIIIFGNSFTIFVFWTRRHHLKRTCFLLINLAIADFIVGITEPITLVTEKIPRSNVQRPGEEELITSPSQFFQILGSSASVFFLALISLERVFAVLWPLRHRVASTKLYICSIVITWAVGICIFILHFVKVEKDIVGVSDLSCRFFSVLIICASYMIIRKRLRSKAHDLEVHRRKSMEHNERLSRTFFLVVTLSLIFWMPAFVVYTIHFFCKPCFPPYAIAIVNILHLANSMVNPFVYTFRMPIFKDALKKLCWNRRRIEIRPVQGFKQALGWRGSFTLHKDQAVCSSGITMTCYKSMDNMNEFHTVQISLDERFSPKPSGITNQPVPSLQF